ncbi:MAG: DMT family transporter [Nitrospirota bacterium]|jgi:drug/metabolite transporter (DMT)-like permease
MDTQQVRRGAALIATASLLFAAMGASVKIASCSLPNEMVVFFRNAAGLVALLPWLLRRGVPTLSTGCFSLHLLRAVSGVSAMYCFFYAIGRMHLAEAVLLNYTMPLFIPFIALVWLREPIPSGVMGAIAIGFAGLLLILKPGPGLFTSAAPVGLASGVLAAVAMVSIRRLTRTEPTTRIVFYFSLIATVVSSLPLTWSWQTPTATQWVPLLASGVFATAGQLFLTHGYAHAPAARLGPFIYLAVVFAGLFGWGLWREIPDALSLTGMAIVCLAGAMTLRSAGRKVAPATGAAE